MLPQPGTQWSRLGRGGRGLSVLDFAAVAECLIALVVAEHKGVRVVVDHGVLVRQQPAGAGQGNGVPSKRGAAAAPLMARRAAGPDMPPPFARSPCRAVTVSATARAVSRSMRSWMPLRLREPYPSD